VREHTPAEVIATLSAERQGLPDPRRVVLSEEEREALWRRRQALDRRIGGIRLAVERLEELDRRIGVEEAWHALLREAQQQHEKELSTLDPGRDFRRVEDLRAGLEAIARGWQLLPSTGTAMVPGPLWDFVTSRSGSFAGRGPLHSTEARLEGLRAERAEVARRLETLMSSR
jgi:hypothetical protein